MLRLLVLTAGLALCQAVPMLEFISWTPIPDSLGRTLPFLNTADRMAFDDRDSYLYVIGGASEQLRILDVRNHTHPTLVYQKTFSEITDGIPKDIAFCRNGNLQEVAIAFANKDPLGEGHVEIFTAYVRFDNTFELIGRVAVESDPSAIKFDNTCLHFVVTCAGLPGTRNNNFEDPIPHIDIFEPAVNGWRKIPVPLTTARGLDQARYIYRDSSIPGHSVLNDLQPSDLVIDDDSMVYVTFYENNAIGKFDLNNVAAGVDIYSLGIKDWNNFDIDTSDRDSAVSPDRINMVRRNIRSFHQPKRLDLLYFNNEAMLLTANTGGYKQYTAGVQGVDFSDAIRGRLLDESLLDPALDAATKADLKLDAQLGRLQISQLQQASDGWNSIQGFFSHPHAYGARSWGIWNTNGITELYDSGSDLEYMVSQYNASIFNSDCFGNNNSPPQSLDTRSDDMGIEPSAITHGMFNGQQVVLVGSGRSGGLWLYTVAEGEAPGLPSATFDSYTRLGSINGNWRDLHAAGDAGIQYINDLIMEIDEHNHLMVFASCSQMGAIAMFEVVDGTFP